jgi:biotin synthase-related radical SAM superfamily protein
MEIIDEPKKMVNDCAETVSQFEANIVKATSLGQSYIEVTEDVFNHKVFKVGTRDTVERLEKMLPEDRAREEAEMKKQGLEWT